MTKKAKGFASKRKLSKHIISECKYYVRQRNFPQKMHSLDLVLCY